MKWLDRIHGPGGCNIDENSANVPMKSSLVWNNANIGKLEIVFYAPLVENQNHLQMIKSLFSLLKRYEIMYWQTSFWAVLFKYHLKFRRSAIFLRFSTIHQFHEGSLCSFLALIKTLTFWREFNQLIMNAFCSMHRNQAAFKNSRICWFRNQSYNHLIRCFRAIIWSHNQQCLESNLVCDLLAKERNLKIGLVIEFWLFLLSNAT